MGRAARGFTLVEVLVSMAILGVLVTFLFGALRQAGDVVTRGSARVESFSSARAALDFMSRELAQTVAPWQVSRPSVRRFDPDPDSRKIVPMLVYDGVPGWAVERQNGSIDEQARGGASFEESSFVFALSGINDSLYSAREVVEVGYHLEVFVPYATANDPTTWTRRLVRRYSAGTTDAFEGGNKGRTWITTLEKRDEVVNHVALFEVEVYTSSGGSPANLPWPNLLSLTEVAEIPDRLHIRLGLVTPTDAVDAWRRVQNESDPEEAWIEDVVQNDLVRIFETSVNLLNAN